MTLQTRLSLRAVPIIALAAFNQALAQVGSEPASADSGAATPPASVAAPEATPSRFHLTLGSDITTAYFFRGIRQEDSAFILQPYADASFDIVRLEGSTVSLKFGTWNSFHSEATAATTNDSFIKYWYESDLYAGLGLTAGKWVFDARYIFYPSPSDAFGTVEEFDFTVRVAADTRRAIQGLKHFNTKSRTFESPRRSGAFHERRSLSTPDRMT